MIETASARLVITGWSDDLIFAQSLAIFGVCLGLALGYSQFKKTAVVWLIIGYSIVLVPWQMALTIEGEILLSERLLSVLGRLLFSLGQFFRREIVEDSLLFVAFISILIWFLSLLSGYWWTRHKNYLVAVLPGGVFTLIIHLYDGLYSTRVWIMGVYILLALFLLGRLHYSQNRKLWKTKRVFQMQESEFDFTRSMMIVSAILIFTAWIFPATAADWQSARNYWRRVTKPWREMQEWLSTAVEVLESPVSSGSVDIFSDRLSLGAGNPLSEDVVFNVRVPEMPQRVLRFYWRGYTYATYSDFGWRASSSNTEDFSPSEGEILIPDTQEREVVQFTVTTQVKQYLLYIAAQPTWVSRTSEIRYSTTNNEAIDLAAWYADPGISVGERFQFEAALADPSIQDLQSAGEEYPEWIAERYLQLPDNFSARIRDLAEEITANYESPYDKTMAITNYLRSEIEYTNPLPEPPPKNLDPLEWILFDLKKGFCNYYASIEVLMLRAIGIPSRLSVGFAEGVFDSESDTYSVRSLDTHAWPEVYFPGIGWVEFEPTSNQNPLVRPNRPEDEVSSELNSTDDDQRFPENRNPESRLDDLESRLPEDIEIAGSTPTLDYRFIYIGFAILLAGFWLINRQYSILDQIPVRLQTAYERNGGRSPLWLINWARWAKLTPTERAFDTVNRCLRILGEHPTYHATPQERAGLLIKKLPMAKNPIEILYEQHQASLFTPDPGHVGQARRASISIWLYTIQSIFQKFFYGPSIE